MKIKFLSLSFILGILSLSGFSQIYVPGGVTGGVKPSNNSFVGIGTASPKASLHVEGSIFIPNEKSLWIGDHTGSSNRLRVGQSNVAGYSHIDYYPALHFRTGTTGISFTMSLLSNGNVGIGTTTPAKKLHVQGDSYFSGNVGIGTSSPAAKLHVNGNLYMQNGRLGIGTANPLVSMQIGGIWAFHDGSSDKIIGRNTYWNGSNNVRIQQGVASRIYFGGVGDIVLQTAASGNAGSTIDGAWNTVVMNNNGNVGIGTMTPAKKLHIQGDGYVSGNLGIGAASTGEYKLRVNGKINCTELVVSLNGREGRGGEDEEIEWPDYVFSEGYSLKNLDEVASFIQQNKHLPEMPSAAEVAENGVNLGEINALLLKKVEELTLYILGLQSQINELKK